MIFSGTAEYASVNMELLGRNRIAIYLDTLLIFLSLSAQVLSLKVIFFQDLCYQILFINSFQFLFEPILLHFRVLYLGCVLGSFVLEVSYHTILLREVWHDNPNGSQD